MSSMTIAPAAFDDDSPDDALARATGIWDALDDHDASVPLHVIAARADALIEYGDLPYAQGYSNAHASLVVNQLITADLHVATAYLQRYSVQL